MLLLDQLDIAPRAAAVSALAEVEAAYAASAPSQHAEPDEAEGHYERASWLQRCSDQCRYGCRFFLYGKWQKIF